MLQRCLIYAGWIAVMAVALWLRVHDLADRPIHFDEATGALIFAEYIEIDDYRFDPTHFHGPLLSLSTTPIAKGFGQSSWQELSVSMLRTGPVIAGLLMVLTPLLWLRTIGPRSTLAAAALLASSPLLVYYNRMYIHESWLALYGMLTAAAIYYVITRPTILRSILAGLAAGLMFATKETVAISLMSWTAAGFACWLLMKNYRGKSGAAPELKAYLLPAICFAVSLLLTASVFYGGGLIDAFRTYFVYETTDGHDKALGYYLKMLVLPKHSLGIWWSEGSVLCFGILTCIFAALRKKGVPSVAICFLAVGAAVHVLIYSVISYKTPWLMLLPWSLACLLAGCVFSGKTSHCNCVGKSVVLYGGFGLCLLFQGNQAIQASGRLSNHADNPYAYVPTSKNITQLPAWLNELDDLIGEESLEPIAVIGQSYWPLPWYLRDFYPIGYWPNAPEEITSYNVIIAMPENTAACNQLLAETHVPLPRTLRSNVPVTLYLKNDIWNAWTEPEK
jgi:uncharacterized protein (TIGR03663 family)